MYISTSHTFKEISIFLESVPVIETHMHYTGKINPIDDVLMFILKNISGVICHFVCRKAIRAALTIAIFMVGKLIGNRACAQC